MRQRGQVTFGVMFFETVNENVVPMDVARGAARDRRETPAAIVLDVLGDVDAVGVRVNCHIIHIVTEIWTVNWTVNRGETLQSIDKKGDKIFLVGKVTFCH